MFLRHYLDIECSLTFCFLVTDLVFFFTIIRFSDPEPPAERSPIQRSLFRDFLAKKPQSVFMWVNLPLEQSHQSPTFQ